MAGVTEFNSDSKETLITKIRKRDGRVVNFEQGKISNAIFKALVATGKPDYPLSERLATKVIQKMLQGEKSIVPSVEDVQDMVESILIEDGLSETAKAYILYRHERRKLRDEKMKILNKKDLDEVDKALDINSLRVLAARYLLRDGDNEIIEGPKQMFERVATLVAVADVLHDPAVFNLAGGHTQNVEEAERYYNKMDDFDNKLHIGAFYLNKYHFEAMIRHYVYSAREGQMKVSFKELLRMVAEGKMNTYEEQIKGYYNLMVSRDFLPNTPTLMNAGARLGQLSACFVLDMPDDMAGIMKSSTDAAMIFKSGGGVGINYSDLRPEGDIVASTSGVASGPTSFMRIIDTITDVVKQGGKRRGANMGILEAWHPDVEKFVTAKTKPGVFENFNVSVGIWEDFWHALVNKEGNHKYALRSPRTREPLRQIDAQQLIDLIALSAWKSAEPGVIFFDNINKYNPLVGPRHGPLRATNPCVAGDTLLATEKGWIPIKSAVNRPTKVFYQEGAAPSQPKGIVMTREDEDVYLVRFTNGMQLRCTADHPLLTPNGMMALRDLREGTKVYLASFPAFGERGTYDEGLMAGWLVGDGYFSGESATLDFYGKDKDVINMFADKLNAMLPNGSGYRQQYVISPIIVEDRDLKSLRSTRLATIMSEKFGITASNKTAMNLILLQTSADFQSGFLQSLFSADGKVNISQRGRQSAISLGSISAEFLRMAQLMLSNFGIKSSIYLRKKACTKLMPDGMGGKKEYDCKDYHELYITNSSIELFMDKIGFLLEYKNEKINEFRKKMNRGFYKDKQYTTIKSIEYLRREPVYDVIETPNHQIAVSGLVTSQCGEQSLYPYESCNLGSINLANFVKRKADGAFEFDWQRYEQAIRLSTRFLDNIIDMNKYPVEDIRIATKETRRIGLGIMGIADLLFLLKIPYNSKDGYEFMNKLAEAVSYLSMDESVTIARSRAPFPMFKDSDYVKGRIPVAGYYELPKETHTYDWDTLIEKIKKNGIRNSWTSTIAPTGTLSMIADTANGVEPVFALVYEKRVTVGRFFYTDKVFENMLKENKLYTDEILTKIANNYGSLRGLVEIPEWMQRVFVTAIDIHWTDHVMAQGVWQKWISNAIAKTINMPGDVTAEDVKCAYLLSHELGLKGVTVFRDGSRHEQVLHITGKNTGEKSFAVKPTRYVADYVEANIREPYVLEQMLKIFRESGIEEERPLPKQVPPHEIVAAPKKPAPQPAKQITSIDADEDRCPTCNARLIITEGCNVCIECGFSGCGSG